MWVDKSSHVSVRNTLVHAGDATAGGTISPTSAPSAAPCATTTNESSCSDGAPGSTGTAGKDAGGGVLDSQGYRPGQGTAGGPGGPGHNGKKGGAKKEKSCVHCSVSQVNSYGVTCSVFELIDSSSPGRCGCGGKGGAGGSGGGGGGASIALFVADELSRIEIISSSLEAGSGGSGVSGKDGSSGSSGKAGAAGATAVCPDACDTAANCNATGGTPIDGGAAGGSGGNGGKGGSGGSGAGGPSVGIAHVAGSTVSVDDGTVIETSNGGNSDGAAPRGTTCGMGYFSKSGSTLSCADNN